MMKTIKVKFLLTAVFAVFCFVNPSFAQQTISPEKKALIKEFLEVMGGRENTDKIMEAMISSQEKEFPKIMASSIEQDKTLTPAQKREMLKSTAEATARVNRRQREFFVQANLPQMIEDMSYPLYDKHFTESELRDLISFYKSATGRKVIAVMPSIMMESMSAFSQAFMPKLQEFLRESTEAELTELKKQKRIQKR